ncbi:MAG: hypothetical protein WCD33_22090 [Mycobacterium sp.]|uniref:hypothetical protein n=1 Tax=Mycobacterium sp. TaxID=1785 RepID=UPI003C7484BB
MTRVIAADECPSVRWMVTTSQPARISPEAYKWRRSCSRLPDAYSIAGNAP